MAKYNIDGVIVNTDNATASWEESTRWNGNNHISVATGSQWEHETLYKSRKGNYWIENVSQWQGSTPLARFVSATEAAAWIMANDGELPDDLTQAGDDVSE